MITKEEILKFLEQQKPEFEQEFNLVKLGLFGSYSRDEQTEDSDIDLLVEFQPETKNLAEKKEKLRAIIEEKFGKKVDMCREKFVKPYFRVPILQSAIYV